MSLRWWILGCDSTGFTFCHFFFKQLLESLFLGVNWHLFEVEDVAFFNSVKSVIVKQVFNYIWLLWMFWVLAHLLSLSVSLRIGTDAVSAIAASFSVVSSLPITICNRYGPAIRLLLFLHEVLLLGSCLLLWSLWLRFFIFNIRHPLLLLRKLLFFLFWLLMLLLWYPRNSSWLLFWLFLWLWKPINTTFFRTLTFNIWFWGPSTVLYVSCLVGLLIVSIIKVNCHGLRFLLLPLFLDVLVGWRLIPLLHIIQLNWVWSIWTHRHIQEFVFVLADWGFTILLLLEPVWRHWHVARWAELRRSAVTHVLLRRWDDVVISLVVCLLLLWLRLKPWCLLTQLLLKLTWRHALVMQVTALDWVILWLVCIVVVHTSTHTLVHNVITIVLTHERLLVRFILRCILFKSTGLLLALSKNLCSLHQTASELAILTILPWWVLSCLHVVILLLRLWTRVLSKPCQVLVLLEQQHQLLELRQRIVLLVHHWVVSYRKIKV